MFVNATNKPIIFFDGVCNLCNTSVQWIIRKDKKNVFHFASLQSNTAKTLLGNNPMQYNSIVLYNNGKVFIKSTAVLHVLKLMGLPFRLLYVLIVVPTFIRNAVYNFVGKNRYKWFGKTDTCLMPSKELMDKFLD
jgi:predicted DCC family thiol-disulfide oxidoreductase YuxK